MVATIVLSKNYDLMLRVTILANTDGFSAVNEFIGEFVDDDYPSASRKNILYWLPEQELDGELFITHFLTNEGIQVILFKSHPRYVDLQENLMKRVTFAKPKENPSS